MTRARLFGVDLDAVTLEQAAEQVVARAREGRGGHVVTMNVDHVVQLQQPGPLRTAYEAAALRYADGMPVVWLSRLGATPLPERVAGADLVPAVLERAAREGLGVHLVGGLPEVAAQAEANVRAAHPGLRWTGTTVPPLGFEADPLLDEALAQEVADAAPDVVLVCLGAPRQEAWALRHQERLPGAVLLCVGAAVDFLAGTKARAPELVVRLGLEWAYRLVQEPRRLWRRYLVQDRAFLPLAVREARRLRRAA